MNNIVSIISFKPGITVRHRRYNPYVSTMLGKNVFRPTLKIEIFYKRCKKSQLDNKPYQQIHNSLSIKFYDQSDLPGQGWATFFAPQWRIPQEIGWRKMWVSGSALDFGCPSYYFSIPISSISLKRCRMKLAEGMKYFSNITKLLKKMHYFYVYLSWRWEERRLTTAPNQ